MNWIDINAEKPPFHEWVLLFCDSQGKGEPKPITIGRLCPNMKWDFLPCQGFSDDIIGVCGELKWEVDVEHITHWMEFPRAPMSKSK